MLWQGKKKKGQKKEKEEPKDEKKMDEEKTEEQKEKKENAEDINLVRTVAGILRNKAGSFHGKRNFEIHLPNLTAGLYQIQ